MCSTLTGSSRAEGQRGRASAAAGEEGEEVDWRYVYPRIPEENNADRDQTQPPSVWIVCFDNPGEC
jgi:hypothetical protein